MGQDRKYASLPDVDSSAPEIYETEEANPTSNPTSPTTPPSSSEDEADASRVSRRTFSPSHARTRFHAARVDARHADFSDRLGDRAAKSYKVSKQTKQGRRRRDVFEGLGGRDRGEVGDGGEADEDETFEERVARLRREVEEVRAVADERSDDGREKVGVEELSDVLKELSVRNETQAKVQRAQTINLSNVQHTQHQPPQSQPTTPDEQPPPQIQQTLHRATALESRLSSLEMALGLQSLNSPLNPSSSTASLANNNPPKPILTALHLLESQLATVSRTLAPPPSSLANGNTPLEKLSSTVQRLTREAKDLEAARQKAAQALREKQAVQQSQAARSRPTSAVSSTTVVVGDGSTRPSAATDTDADPGLAAEQAQRIARLRSTLPTIEALAPLLPPVLDRLRSLKRIHADAAVAGEGLREVERRQGICWEELGKWRGAVERVEDLVGKAQQNRDGNRRLLEEWVKGLEGRVGRLEHGVEPL